MSSKSSDATVWSRRDVLVNGVVGAIALAGFNSRTGTVLAGTPGVTVGETPGLEEGPFFVDGQAERSDVRTDSSTGVSQSGTPLYLGLTVSQLSDSSPYTISPLVGARVDIWSANAQGVYSDESSESTTGTDYLRGYQLTNDHGNVQFITLFPGWYGGRTQHVHLYIRVYSGTTLAYSFFTQMFFDEAITEAVIAANTAYTRTTTQDTTNTTDRVVTGASANDSPASDAGDYTIMTIANDVTNLQGTFHVILDLSDSSNSISASDSSGGGGGTGGPGGMGGSISPPATAPAGSGSGSVAALTTTKPAKSHASKKGHEKSAKASKSTKATKSKKAKK